MRSDNTAELVIEAGRTERMYWKDIWHYRELFYFLVWRDVLVRYKQTTLGIAWALILPLLTMLVLTLVFASWQSCPPKSSLSDSGFCGDLALAVLC